MKRLKVLLAVCVVLALVIMLVPHTTSASTSSEVSYSDPFEPLWHHNNDNSIPREKGDRKKAKAYRVTYTDCPGQKKTLKDSLIKDWVVDYIVDNSKDWLAGNGKNIRFYGGDDFVKKGITKAAAQDHTPPVITLCFSGALGDPGTVGPTVSRSFLERGSKLATSTWIWVKAP